MVNAQEWLDKNYPKENRSKTREIYINEQLEGGKLDVREFDDLWGGIAISSSVDENKFQIINSERTWVKKLIDAQEWLEQKFTKEKRNEVEWLDTNGENLENVLNLSDFPNLKKVNVLSNIGLVKLNITNSNNLKEICCVDNENLTHLSLINCPQLEIVWCNANKTTDLKIINCPEIIELRCHDNYFPNLNFLTNVDSDKLRKLWISDNNILTSDLIPFARFVNLDSLYLGNDFQRKIEQGIINHFQGSLKPLENCPRLKWLGISNTNIDSGLEYLPESIQVFYCLNVKNSQSKAKLIEKELRKYGEPIKDDYGYYNFAHLFLVWKKDRLKTQQQKVCSQLTNQETKELEEARGSRKSKGAKQKEKLVLAQKRIEQLEIELEAERNKNVSLQEAIINQKRELEVLRERNSTYEKYFQRQKTENEKLESQLSQLQIHEQQNQIEQPPK